jgi:hypothetical protein
LVRNQTGPINSQVLELLSFGLMVIRNSGLGLAVSATMWLLGALAASGLEREARFVV